MAENGTQRYSPFGRIGGILTVFFILLSSFYGTVFIYFPLLPLMILSPRLYRRLIELLGSSWHTTLVVS